MRRLTLSLLSLLPIAYGCSGGGGSVPPLTVAEPQIQSEAQSDAAARSPLTTIASSGNADKLYVGNVGNNSITVYAHDARGNTAPLSVIAGSKTEINSPGQLSQDAQGNLYVANGSTVATSNDPAVLVFAPGAHGNVAPIRKLAGTATHLTSISAMLVDKSSGKVFVVNNAAGQGYPASLLRFSAGSSGNTAPYAVGNINYWANQIASDSTGLRILEAHLPPCCSVSNAGVDVWFKQFANGTTPAYGPGGIRAMLANGIADDPTTKTYVISNDSGIWRLAETTTGQGPYNNSGAPADFKPAAKSIITNDTCGGQLALPPGPQPYTYVMHSSVFGGCSADGVYVYSNDANGNATPVRILGGSATQMSKPYGIYEGS